MQRARARTLIGMLATAVAAAVALPPVVAQAADGVAFMPAVLRRADRDLLLHPPTAMVTRTPLASATPDASNTPTPTATSTPVPLAQRLTVQPVDIDSRLAIEMGMWTSFPIVSAPRYDGSMLVGWSTSSGQIRITPLDADRRREGPDISFRGESIHGLVAHPDGGAALYVSGDEMRLRRFGSGGSVAFEKALVGTAGRASGDKWIDDWSHEGRLGWTGELYVTYFGHTQNWGSRGKHQGDLLWLFDADGQKVEGSSVPGYYPTWDWGCSHSIDVRLSYNSVSDAVGPVCLSDEFPQDGVIWSRSIRIAAMAGDGGGHVNGELGGLVTLDRGFAVTYVSKTDRRSYDVGLSILDESGHSVRDSWLTDTPNVNETSAHLAAYGGRLLAAWKSGGSLLLSVVDPDGTVADGPVPVPADIALRDDFFNYPDGRVGWTYAGSGRSSLEVATVDLP